jgi:hypothetical protein
MCVRALFRSAVTWHRCLKSGGASNVAVAGLQRVVDRSIAPRSPAHIQANKLLRQTSSSTECELQSIWTIWLLARIRRTWSSANATGESTVSIAAEREIAHLGETCGCADHDHDLIHELSRRLDSLWRYDQYIANCDWRDSVRQILD